jgi:putative transposase
VRPVFERLFRAYGLPDAIRTDNGVPFATTGIHGLSQLNVWWLRLGIQHQRSRPASPQDNGAHERLHKTLKAEAIRPPRATLAPQQGAFNRFREPASRYRTSPRPYPGTLPPIEYPGHFIVKRITGAGTFRFKTRLLFLAKSLKQHPIGLEEVDDGIWSIHFCGVLLARIDERDYVIRG